MLYDQVQKKKRVKINQETQKDLFSTQKNMLTIVR